MLDGGETDTITGGKSVTVAWADVAGFATDMAEIVIELEAGIAAGGVYNPAAEIFPTAAEPPAIPFTVQVTLVFGLPVTVAVKGWVFGSCTETDAGNTDTVTVGGTGMSVRIACPNEEGVASDVARIAIELDAGMTAGAV